MFDVFLRDGINSDDSRDADSANPDSININRLSRVVVYLRSTQCEHPDDCQLFLKRQLHC
jgi:hypothetical protein